MYYVHTVYSMSTVGPGAPRQTVDGRTRGPSSLCFAHDRLLVKDPAHLCPLGFLLEEILQKKHQTPHFHFGTQPGWNFLNASGLPSILAIFGGPNIFRRLAPVTGKKFPLAGRPPRGGSTWIFTCRIWTSCPPPPRGSTTNP